MTCSSGDTVLYWILIVLHSDGFQVYGYEYTCIIVKKGVLPFLELSRSCLDGQLTAAPAVEDGV